MRLLCRRLGCSASESRMPDYGVFVTFEQDPYGWGSEFPLGRFACSFQRACVEWSRGHSVLRNTDTCEWPVEIHMWRYRYDRGDDAVVRLSFRDVRSAARGIFGRTFRVGIP